jgi:hypothetical protein
MAQAQHLVAPPITRVAGTTRERLERRFVELLPTRRLAVVGGALMAALVIPGVMHATGVLYRPLFDYDGEKNIPATVSASFLGIAGIAAVFWAFRAKGRGAWASRVLAILFLFMSADEFGQMHEKLERITGVDWQLLYVPIMGMAAVAAVALLRRMTSSVTRWLFCIGGACWGIAGVLEVLEYNSGDHRVHGYVPMMLMEENLELLGGLLFAVTMIMLIEHARSNRAARESLNVS